MLTRAHSARRLRSIGVAIVVALTVVVLSACSSPAEPRPLTAEESRTFALIRLNNYTAGVREVSFTVTDKAVTYEVDAWVDFPAHIGYGTATSPDSNEILTLAWGDDWIASMPATSANLPPLPPASDPSMWQVSALVPEQSRLHTMLALMFVFSNGQPDNPQLLAQTDARWEREDAIDDTPVTVFRGPNADTVDPDPSKPNTTGHLYWVTADSTLLRVEVTLGGTGAFIPIDFSDAPEDVQFTDELTQMIESVPQTAG